jgi:hypothetical protein
MSLERLFPGQGCRRCGGTVNIPHYTYADCTAALRSEMEQLLTMSASEIASTANWTKKLRMELYNHLRRLKGANRRRG